MWLLSRNQRGSTHLTRVVQISVFSISGMVAGMEVAGFMDSETVGGCIAGSVGRSLITDSNDFWSAEIAASWGGASWTEEENPGMTGVSGAKTGESGSVWGEGG